MRNTVRRLCESDDSGTVHLDVSVGAPRRRVTVQLVWEDFAEASLGAKGSDELGWPPGFFERFPGIFADDPIERGEQGIVEEIPPLELD